MNKQINTLKRQIANLTIENCKRQLALLEVEELLQAREACVTHGLDCVDINKRLIALTDLNHEHQCSWVSDTTAAMHDHENVIDEIAAQLEDLEHKLFG